MVRGIRSLLLVLAGGALSQSPQAFGQVVVPTHGTYMGGPGVDRLQDVHDSSSGKVYSCGNTKSGVIPFPNGLPGDDHLYVAASNDGIALITSQDFLTVYAWTYIGGTGDDRAYAIRTDDQGFVYVYGFTESAARAG